MSFLIKGIDKQSKREVQFRTKAASKEEALMAAKIAGIEVDSIQYVAPTGEPASAAPAGRRTPTNTLQPAREQAARAEESQVSDTAWVVGSLLEMLVGAVIVLSLVLTWEMRRHISRTEGWGTIVWAAVCAALAQGLSKRLDWARQAAWGVAAAAGVWMAVMGARLPAEAALSGGLLLWLAAGASMTTGMVLLLLKGGPAVRMWIGAGAAALGLVLYQMAVLNVGWPGAGK